MAEFSARLNSNKVAVVVYTKIATNKSAVVAVLDLFSCCLMGLSTDRNTHRFLIVGVFVGRYW
jgi:hypothetical protein